MECQTVARGTAVCAGITAFVGVLSAITMLVAAMMRKWPPGVIIARGDTIGNMMVAAWGISKLAPACMTPKVLALAGTGVLTASIGLGLSGVCCFAGGELYGNRQPTQKANT